MTNTTKYTVLAIFSYLIIEAMSGVGLLVLKYTKGIHYGGIGQITSTQKEILQRFLRDDSFYYRFDKDLGWSIRASASNSLYKSNSQGLRGNREYAQEIPAGRLRVATFGDSFTHADDVANEHTWQQQVENLNANLELPNYGVSGYGPGQAYLRYQIEGAALSPDVVLIGYMSENLYRSVNTFRPFYSPHTLIPLAKPRYLLNNQGLVLHPNTLNTTTKYVDLLNGNQEIYRNLQVHDYYAERGYHQSNWDFSPLVRFCKLLHYTIRYKFHLADSEISIANTYNTKSEAFNLSLEILQQFYSEVKKSGATPLVVLFPTMEDVARYKNSGQQLYEPLLKQLELRDVDYIDLAPILSSASTELPTQNLFKTHLTPHGNGIVAAALNEKLGEMYRAKFATTATPSSPIK